MESNKNEPSLDDRLNQAINLLAEFVCQSIPEGWDIRFTLQADEASLSLNDPWGNDREIVSEVCTIREMVDHAVKDDLDYRENAQIDHSKLGGITSIVGS